MKIYALIFLLICHMFEQGYTSSLDWKKVLVIRHHIREIKSIIDNVLIPLKIATYKEGSLEAMSCYIEAKSKLSNVQQRGYSNLTKCIINSKKDMVTGIICALNVQKNIRKSSQVISTEADKCFSDLTIANFNSTHNKKRISEILSKKPNPI